MFFCWNYQKVDKSTNSKTLSHTTICALTSISNKKEWTKESSILIHMPKINFVVQNICLAVELNVLLAQCYNCANKAKYYCVKHSRYFSFSFHIFQSMHSISFNFKFLLTLSLSLLHLSQPILKFMLLCDDIFQRGISLLQ